MIKVFATAFMMMFLVLGQAQKVAHLNSAILLSENPKIKQADLDVQKMAEGLELDYQNQVKAFQEAYIAFESKMKSQEYSAVVLQKDQEALVQQEQKLQLLQQTLQQQINRKREELYAPVLLELEKTVQEFGKAEGYTMIFDSSLGGILYGMDGQDVTEQIKAKLGY